MKKQFNRMKQLANQTVGRAEKTEVLSDDLLQIERRMEVVRLVSHNALKRMTTCLQGHVGTDVDKRHKKLPLTGLSQVMQEGGVQLGEESLIGKMIEACGDVENKLAYEQSMNEVRLERDVMDPLSQLAEVEIPNILKQRKQLAKLVLDYDSAKARYQQAAKSVHGATNFQAMTAKVDSLKEEMDEALTKVEMCKDQLSADLYNFSSKEGDHARYYVMLLEAQAEYHKKCLELIENALPSIQIQQETWTEMPAFGTALEEHLRRSNREIALPMEACVMMLLETGMKEEGLFRIAAGASKLKKLKAALDCSTSQLEEFYSDPHAVAGALKSYLRELPEPLMTFSLYDEWIKASNVSDSDQRLQALWVTCNSLPDSNKANFRYLVKFLAKLAQESDVNKMTPSNIAIVLGPNLLWAKTEGSLAEMAAATSVHVVAIIEPIIQHADWFFPDEVDFNVSGMFSMPGAPTHHMGYPGTPDSDTEKRRPGSQGGQEADTPRKDSNAIREPASTPPLLRNGPGGIGGTPGQLNVGTPMGGSRGPSPHMLRRGTKKQAPAPPKNVNPHTSKGTPIPVPIPTVPVSSAQPVIAPRRHSNNQNPIQAPNHPPPQPPQSGGSAEPDPSPPSTPTPPDTPPHDGLQATPLSSFHSGSLPRPRPMPRPRSRPNIPPPAQPPQGASDVNGMCSSASKIITDVEVSLKGPGRVLVPDLAVDQPVPSVPEPERQSESTML
ncbi:rho GTPase-activating protein 17b [Chanos chanos]|uniref:Rho GTPase-activating protein 17 n=1 Tax=Chanos chanos TaxID=29144 RepID=A0A6J2WQM7_CHACN|nr:rho GTPase-activating protein 17-like [Chanos chanos]